LKTLAKLTWQCRRGTRELDYFLTHYVENFYHHAESTEQQQFQQLVNLEDNELLALFFTQSSLQHQELIYLVEKIRHAAAICHQ
jgi:antitoxin CptB